MRKLILLALAATAIVPVAASAQTSRGELRRDRADVREERGEYRVAQRYGSPSDIREERGEYRDAREEYREDRRDWRDEHRRGPRYGYGRGHHDRWNASHYRYANSDRWGLPHVRGPFHWVRDRDDALLIDERDGDVVRVIRHFF